MNRNLLIILVIALALMVALIGHNRQQKMGKVPWDITVLPDGRVHVLGITLNQTTIQEANQILGNFAEPRLYLQPTPHLLAVHENVWIAGMLARVDLQYHLDDTRLAVIQQAALPGSENSYFELTQEQQIDLLATPIVKLIYTPAKEYSEGGIERRFGEPDKKQKVSEQSEIWTYSKLGLTVTLNANGPDTFIYTALAPPPPLEPLLFATDADADAETDEIITTPSANKTAGQKPEPQQSSTAKP